MIKAPKLYFLDTGLAAFLTKWQNSETLSVSTMAGAFLETFVLSEIIKSYWNHGKEAPIYYFRDKEHHEVDLIIESEGQLYPIEIKLAANINKTDFANINYLRKIEKNVGHGAIICLTKQILPIDSKNLIIPVWQIC
jgi:predicted AAA+ superfamily ATPase